MKRRLADAPAVIAVAAELGDVPGVDPNSPLAWLALLDDARGALDAVRKSPSCPPALLPERDLHAGRGMSLGLWSERTGPGARPRARWPLRRSL